MASEKEICYLLLYYFLMETIASQESKLKLLTRHFISPEAMDVH